MSQHQQYATSLRHQHKWAGLERGITAAKCGISLHKNFSVAESRLENLATSFLTPNRPAEASESDIFTSRNTMLNTRIGQIAVWSIGKGPKVLLVHGWSGTHSDLSPFAAALAAKGFNVIAIDLPAHGRSGGSTASISDMVEILLFLATKAVKLDGIIAYSVGCLATVAALQKGLSASRIVLLAPPASYGYFIEAFARHVGVECDRLMATLHLQGIDVKNVDLPLIATSLRGCALIVHSVDDRVVPWEHGAAIAASWRGAVFHKVTKLGHKTLLRDRKVIELVVEHMAWLLRSVTLSDTVERPVVSSVIKSTHVCRGVKAVLSRFKALLRLI